MPTQTPGALIDLHAHTRHKSMDSGLAPEKLAERAKALGLSAVCITEHNNIWTAAEAAALAEAFEIPVLRGMEVSTDAGHVLVFGVEGYSLDMWRIERLHAIVQSEGGAMVLAHPSRSPGFGRPWSEAPDLFVGLEVFNGDDHHRGTEYLVDLARSLGLPGTGGSDAHSVQAVGRRATRFERTIMTDRDLVAALRSGCYCPVDLTATTVVNGALKRAP
jgi:predicted metal-dependent phosphoesterase TrpH